MCQSVSSLNKTQDVCSCFFIVNIFLDNAFYFYRIFSRWKLKAKRRIEFDEGGGCLKICIKHTGMRIGWIVFYRLCIVVKDKLKFLKFKSLLLRSFPNTVRFNV